MARYKKIKLNMRKENIDKLVLAFLSGYAPSRMSVANECNVSSATSGKVANALIESGFMVEKTFSRNGESSRAHLFCRECASILLIDLSSSVFCIKIINSLGEVKFRASYNYDPSVGPLDNLYIFISRHGERVRKSGHGFCAISVMYADENSLEYLENDYIKCSLPRISDKAVVTQAVYDIFGKKPASHLTVSKAICEAIRFKLHGDMEVIGGISYIFIGSHVSIFHIYENMSVAVCSPKVILDTFETAPFSPHKYISSIKAEQLFVRLADFMGAAFSPSSILLESDTFVLSGETAQMITRKFSLFTNKSPNIYTKNASNPLRELGAVRSTLYSIISRYVT